MFDPRYYDLDFKNESSGNIEYSDCKNTNCYFPIFGVEDVNYKVDIKIENAPPVKDGSFYGYIKYAKANEWDFFACHSIRKINNVIYTGNLSKIDGITKKYTKEEEESSLPLSTGIAAHLVGNKRRSQRTIDYPTETSNYLWLSPRIETTGTNEGQTLDENYNKSNFVFVSDIEEGLHIRNWDARDRCLTDSGNENDGRFTFEKMNPQDGYNPPYKTDFVSSSISLLSADLSESGITSNLSNLVPDGATVSKFPKNHMIIDLNKLNSIESPYYNACDSNLEPVETVSTYSYIDKKTNQTRDVSIPTSDQKKLKTLYLGIGYTQEQVVKSTISMIDNTPRYYPNKGITLYQYDNYDDYVYDRNRVNVMPNFNSDSFNFNVI
jgi:hypothetical protein